jgi:D-serine deaminase-like pyridoxal phosphate-dependent protein
MAHPRAVFLDLPEAEPVMHSEEHLVVETPRAAEFEIGAALHALPWHVCPTVALHAEAWVLNEGTATTRWPVVARARRLSI